MPRVLTSISRSPRWRWTTAWTSTRPAIPRRRRSTGSADELLAGQDSVAAELRRLDCSETLGVIVQRLQAIEDHPALSMTPQQYGQALRAASEAASRSERSNNSMG